MPYAPAKETSRSVRNPAMRPVNILEGKGDGMCVYPSAP